MRQQLMITAGTGPVEVRRFVGLLAAWLVEECGRRGLRVESVVHKIPNKGDEDAPASVRLTLHSDGLLRDLLGGDLLGSHVLVNPSRGRRARKRWYAAVSASPIPELKPVTLDPREVSVSACRAGGPGGQHVNTCASAVRAVHRPTGLAVRVSERRSQHANRVIALKRLAEALSQEAQAEVLASRDRRWRRHHQLERGRPVRRWRLDHRGGLQDTTPSRDGSFTR